MVQLADTNYIFNENNGRDGVFLLSAKGDVIYANENANTFFAFKIGSSFLSVIPKKDREKIYSFYEKLSRGESISYVSSSIKNVEVSIYPITKEKNVVMFVGVIKDITRIKEMELCTKKILKKEEIFRENVSHYFFNPLVIAKGYLQLLLNEDVGKKERKKLEAIKTAVERIEAVVKNTVTKGNCLLV